MADFNYDEFGSGYEDSYADHPRLAARAQRWVNIAGAVCSVSLVLGLAFWGYRLAVRDVTGVPVMRAVAGAMRIAPADPGGEQALNQGLTVNAIAAMGTSAAPADQVTLAPAPVALQEADVPTAEAAPVAPDAGLPAAATLLTSPEVTAATDTVLPADVQTSPDAVATIATTDPNAIRRSLRPQARPAGTATASAAAAIVAVPVAAKSTAPAVKELNPAKLAAGTRLAQLGAFDSPEQARKKFADLQTYFGDLMAGKDLVIQSATSGGRTFYRLRAHGFDSDADVRGFCSALQAEETDCIPVTQR